MTKGSMRWMVGLLAGGTLAVAGCEGPRGERPDQGAFRTPIQDRYQSPAAGIAEHGDERYRHPTDDGREGEPGMVPMGSQDVDVGIPRPTDTVARDEVGLTGVVGDGLGTGLADSYRAGPGGPGGTATGGSGIPGGSLNPGGPTGGSAPQQQGDTSGAGGAGTAGGGASGQQVPR